ncbi:MAG: DUF4080 domain-containing protein [Gammaproteobacteria bacterium]|nr:DUF4080 domain-containing protein [Gammaproteobacteria bacterium]
MPAIVLSTFNARYIHTAMGLRYLHANLGALSNDCCIREFTIQQQPTDIVEALLALNPKIIGLGTYIWNIELTTQVAGMLKQVRPDIQLILGGPEISFETEQQTIFRYADYVLCGAADHLFREVCEAILLENNPPTQKIQHALPAALDTLALPYALYSDEDIAHRIIYVEASRGCPFKCEFCLSALDKTAKPFDLDLFLREMEQLFERGARHFKFVDRTFNLKIAASIRIMEFFLQRIDQGVFLHFELIPDHLPEALKEVIARFPEGSLQFEIGIQSFDPNVQQLISRRQDNSMSMENIRWLRNHTQAHLHTDLIAGLPGETLQSFAKSFDLLAGLNPHEIQVGILKRLRGTPLIRHTQEFALKFNPSPPYNILATRDMNFATMQRLNRFARYWDMIANSGRFSCVKPIILGDAPFERFMQLADWLFATSEQTHKISLKRLFTLVYQGLTESLNLSADVVLPAMLQDYANSGEKGLAPFGESLQNNIKNKKSAGTLQRQSRHLN